MRPDQSPEVMDNRFVDAQRGRRLSTSVPTAGRRWAPWVFPSLLRGLGIAVAALR